MPVYMIMISGANSGMRVWRWVKCANPTRNTLYTHAATPTIRHPRTKYRGYRSDVNKDGATRTRKAIDTEGQIQGQGQDPQGLTL